ncbi:Nucleic acid-binding, OB-fold [Pseudocohnilembus persalinus]|uniref:Nucleic acid-binding, OB-fold n=1 Tax=Pseudocohnilembus persalinus TaxID=266149 RepID=A0A0V0QML1_PSEPJ|nr:Nucleic acid-binding, OB-fold [Pseudocohnilembus persalinus]|eukprot:KRX03593.1 Nucleic acid-binding, OB-fold [Pseudocohnilembus persalinus]
MKNHNSYQKPQQIMLNEKPNFYDKGRKNSQQHRRRSQRLSDSEDYDQSNRGKQHKEKNHNNNKRNHNKNQNNQNENHKSHNYNRPQYPEYYTQEQVELGIKNEVLFKGMFIANDKDRNRASIKLDRFPVERFQIYGGLQQNRALHKSTVVVQFFSKKEKDQIVMGKEFGLLKLPQMIIEAGKAEQLEQLKKEQKKQENGKTKQSDKDEDEEESVSESLSENQSEKYSEDLSEDYEDIDEDEEEQLEDNLDLTNSQLDQKEKQLLVKLKKLHAIVVSIEKNVCQDKTMIGYLKLNKYNELLFTSLEKRLFQFRIEWDNKEIYEKVQADENYRDNTYFKGVYQGWPITQRLPVVKINDELGEKGNIEIECQALLQDNNVYVDDFSQECTDYLKSFDSQLNENNEYIIPDEERNKREDLTNTIICTIDPATARDLDDALSIKKLENGNYEVGVHIADVSYFVAENTILDEEARLRTTSVYLPHRVIPMLPRLLCENLCSLNPGVERLAFSCFFEMKEDGTLIEKTARFSKSIIKSCVKFSYEIVQDMIENKINSVEDLPEQFKPVGVDPKQLFDCIFQLQTIGMKRREQRTKSVPFKIEKPKKRFQLDEDGWPLSFSPDVRKDANFVVEEFMLIANKLVARKLVDTAREIAVLRNHSFPQDKKIEEFKKTIQQITSGSHVINFANSITIKKGLESIEQSEFLKQEYKDIIRYKMVKMLEQAKYFVVQDEKKENWHHFALDFDVYTHFTSPIRRYPDVLVHRLLYKAITLGSDMRNEVDQKQMIEIMDKCNECKQASRKIQDGCDKIFTCLYLKNNEAFTEAIVTQINSVSFWIIIPEFNIEKEIAYGNQSFIEKCEYDGVALVFKFKKQENDDVGRTLILTPFQKFQVKLTSTDQFPIDYQIHFCVRNRQFETITFG